MKNLIKAQRALLTLLVVSFVTLFSVGCDSSSNDFVFTGTTGDAPPTTGNLVFQFQQPAPQTIVPVGTTTLRFDLYAANSANPDNLFLTATFGYNDRIVIRDVVSQVRFAVVTFFNRDGLPLGTQSGPVEVIVGQDNDVTDNLGPIVPVPFESISVSPDPVNLVLSISNPTRVSEQQLSLTGSFGGNLFFLPINDDVTFNVANGNVANVSSSGLVSARLGVGNQPAANTTVTATYTFNGVPQVDTFTIRSFIFTVVAEERNIPRGGSEQLGLIVFGADGQQIPMAEEPVTFSLQSNVEGVTISPNGLVTTSNSTPLGDFTVVATWVDQRPGGTGLTFTDTFTFTVVTQQTM